jgi:undecaprenyl diphosphate synthase
MPKHVAIIMDGNGRWAQARNHHRVFGHVRGARTARHIIEHASRLGIQYLSLFAFSSENWRRPASEVSFLMKLLAKQLLKELPTLKKNNIRLRIIGDLSTLPEAAQKIVERATHETESNTGLQLVFALSYGGRQEIAFAAKKIAEKVKAGKLNPSEIDEDIFTNELYCPHLPDPDLVIRTSGEFRISNFMLWQIAYSEILILDKHWPDFTSTDLDLALSQFSLRERRFGTTLAHENHVELS